MEPKPSSVEMMDLADYVTQMAVHVLRKGAMTVSYKTTWEMFENSLDKYRKAD